MLFWAIGFLILALFSAALGYSGLAQTASGLAQVLFFVFLCLSAVTTAIRWQRKHGKD